MAANDPAYDVATPTGVLQGVAAFGWDGTTWQPAGRAGPSVATPTGVLQGIAPFTGGTPWAPSGRAGPGVATPSGVLDGVAVYTWSGSAWTPPVTPSTATGALRGVAAFNWDGAAWQPNAQAGPSVPTPFGVLQGVAMFNWSGTAWAAQGAPSLNLDFLTPGTLDPRITFTRASTATYIDSAGTMQTAAINAPRWDYNPATLALRGLLIEEARTNLLLQSGNLANASWTKASVTVAAPVVTANQTVAPDGTLTASSLVYPAVSIAGSVSGCFQGITATAAAYTGSIWLRGSVGGEQIYLYLNSGASYPATTRVTLTTAWQRFVISATLTATAWSIAVGTDLRDVGQSSTAAMTIYAWGAQLEAAAFATSYIPTTGITVTRGQEFATMATSPWHTSPAAFSCMAEAITQAGVSAGTPTVIVFDDGTTSNRATLLYDATPRVLYFEATGGVTTIASTIIGTAGSGVVFRAAFATAANSHFASLNGGVPVGNTNAAAPPTVTTLRFGRSSAAISGVVWMRTVKYWPRALSAAELQAVTT